MTQNRKYENIRMDALEETIDAFLKEARIE